MKISLTRFRGSLPALTDTPAEYATEAVDADLRSGVVRALRKNGLVKAGDFDSIYGGEKFVVCERGGFTYAEGPPSCGERIFRSGGGTVSSAYIADALAGNWKRLDFPVNNTPCAITVLSEVDRSEFSSEFTNCVFTYVNSFGEESGPSVPSSTVEVSIGSSLMVSGLPTPAGDYDVVRRRLYLYHKGVFTGSEKENPITGGYFLVAEVAPTSTTAELVFGSPTNGLTTQGYESANPRLRDVVSWRSGQLAGLIDNRLAFSTPNVPTSWPAENQMIFYGKAVRFVVGVSKGYVLTDTSPFVVDLNEQCDKPQCHKGRHLAQPLPCIAGRSAATYGDTLLFASESGMAVVRDGAASILPLWDELSWAEINPVTMIGIVHGAYYYGFTDSCAFRFRVDDVKAEGLVYLSDTGVKEAVVSQNGQLLIATEAGVEAMFASPEFRVFSWKKEFNRLDSAVCLSAYRVGVRHTPATVKHWMDGDLIDESTLTNESTERLPVGYAGTRAGVCFSGTGEVSDYEVATSLQELLR